MATADGGPAPDGGAPTAPPSETWAIGHSVEQHTGEYRVLVVVQTPYGQFTFRLPVELARTVAKEMEREADRRPRLDIATQLPRSNGRPGY